MKNRIFLAAGALVLGGVSIAAGPIPMVWSVDAPHSAVTFSVRHFFTPVTGQFDQFDVELAYDQATPENSFVRVSIPVASISTGNERRDNHLRSADFFEATTHPAITFESTSVTKVSDTRLVVRGPLTIKGTTRIVELPIEILGVMDVPAEMREMLGDINHIASFETKLKLNRGDFGVGVGSWATNMVVGSDVEIAITIEANR